MIGLNPQFEKLPLVFVHHLMNNLLKPLFHWPSKRSTPIRRDKKSDDQQGSGPYVGHAAISIRCHFSLVHLMFSLSPFAFEGGYRFDRMALPGPFDILGFASRAP